MSKQENKNNELMEKIVSLCKRRGFVFPSSEIYGGFAGVYDLGPFGVELAKNLKEQWWNKMVYQRDDIVGLDSSIFMSPKIWEASGHTKGFSDPLIECKECNTRHRADKMLEEVGVMADEKTTEEEINKIFNENKEKIKCPSCGKQNFTTVRKFNLLVKSNLGDFTNNNSDPAYLRGETCQGIYVNYKNIMDSIHPKIPFGIAQVGKAFRNEISPRQFLFRGREFEQMEMQYFTTPEGDMDEYEKLKEYRWNALLELGLNESNLRWKQHENLVFYAKEAYDIEYKYPWGFDEMEGIHARGNYDLTQHSKGCGKELNYFDQKEGKRFIPHIIESSGGVGRLFLAVLLDAYTEDKSGDETRVYLNIKPSIAPIKAMVSPLLRNKPELVSRARGVYEDLRKEISPIMWDDNGNIGKRYRRQDEIGTPFCVVVDFDTLEQDDSVSVRDRNTTEQERVKISELADYLKEKLS